MARHRERVVVVTGASAGVGRAVVRKLGAQGASVGLLARGEDGLNAAKAEIEAAGGRALALPTDVADAEAVRAAAAAVERELGPIDVWINNAMTAVFARTWEIPPDEFRRVTEVTYLGVVHGTMAALEHMMPRRRGKIVQVGSALAYRGIPLQASYCGAKHAIQGFTESLRCELMHDEIPIGLTMVQLPALNTPQFGWVRSRLPRSPQPVPPIFQPEVAADAILYATEHDRREIFVGGPTYKAIWGNKLAPWLGDLILARSGFDSQQRDQLQPPDRPDNLFSPLPGDHGAHGAFDARAKSWSAALWMSTHRGLTAAATGLAVAGLVAAALSRDHR